MSTPEQPGSSHPTEQQKRILWAGLTAVAFAALLAVALLAFVGFLQLLSLSCPITMPLLLGVLVALIFKPVVDFFEARGLSRMPTTLIVCVMIVAGFVIFWAFVLPPVYTQTKSLVSSMPGYIDNATKQILTDTQPVKPATTSSFFTPGVPAVPESPATSTNAAPVPPAAVPAKPSPSINGFLKANLPAIQEDVTKYLATAAAGLLAPVGSAFFFILGFGFVPVYVFYFIADEDHLAKHWQEFVPFRPGRLRDEAIAVTTEFSQVLVNYLRGQIIVAAVNGLLTFIGLTIIDVPYSVVLGILAGALSIVPFLGIITSILPALVLAFTSAKDDPTMMHVLPHESWTWVKPLLVLVVFALVQMSESMFVSPRVQSHSTGLHPIVIILGILVWSMLLPGLLGPIVAVPLTCAVVVLLRRYVWRDVPRRKREKLKAKGIESTEASGNA